jgi:hypothetical protein
MKIKLQIKNRFTGSILFEFKKENNTIKETLVEAVKQGAYLRCTDLQGADLRGAYLRGADLQCADLRGAYLRGTDLQCADLRGADLQCADLQCEKIKTTVVFTGLYQYIVIPYITEENIKRIKMGCYNRSLEEWESDFWNNNIEFPNDGSMKSNLRLMAYNTAKAWLELQDKI